MSNVNEVNFEKFSIAYREGLREAVEYDAKRTEENRQFWYGPDKVEEVVARMLKTIREKPMGVNYNSDGLRRTCKRLGIPFSRKAILEYLGLTSGL